MLRRESLRVVIALSMFFLLSLFGANESYVLAQFDPLDVEPSPSQNSGDFVEYVPSVLLLKVKIGVELASVHDAASAAVVSGNAPALVNLLQQFGTRTIEPLFSVAHTSVDAADGIGSFIYRVVLSPETDVETAAKVFALDDSVVFAEPDYIARSVAVPNDPDLSVQWALTKISAQPAWDVTTGDPSVVVAVLDSGIDLTHSEFQGRLWQNDDAQGGGDSDGNGFVDDTNGWNFVANNRNLADANGHGTQVAGIIGAKTNNASGIAGLCWQCSLMPVVVMQPSGAANYSDIARAILYASSNGAQIINISLGGYADSLTLHDAIAEASVSSLIVASAGNDDSATPFYPAAYPEVMAVAASDDEDKKWIGSNYGSWIDVIAPGEGIRTTTVGNSYLSTDGTSMAAGYVSALAGLIKSHNPGWTPEQVKWQIANTVASVANLNPGFEGQLGTGRIRAQQGLTIPAQPQLSLVTYALDGVSGARPEPGQNLSLVVTLKNTWMPSPNLNATLTSSDPNVSITDSSGSWIALPSGQSGANTGNPFAVTLKSSAPFGAKITFALQISGSGGYAESISFTIQVRNSVITLGNTEYTVASVTTPDDTVTWTSDRIWVLDGSVIVGPGVTLKIEPGTEIRVASGKFIRIEGKLLADGTDKAPILFTEKIADQQRWTGVVFTASSNAATYEENGQYTEGNIVRHVVLEHAENALSMQQPVYIADSIFQENGNGIESKYVIDGQVTRVETSQFVNNQFYGIYSDGPVLVRDSIFTGNRSGGVMSRRAGTVTESEFYDNEVRAIAWVCEGSNCLPSNIEGNIMYGNGNGVELALVPVAQIANNLFMANKLDAIQSYYSLPTITGNNLIGSEGFEVALAEGDPLAEEPYPPVDARGNYWGVATSAISNRIADCIFDPNGCGEDARKAKVLWDPPLASPSANAPAYVTSIVADPDPVGIQNLGLFANFSRPMEPTSQVVINFHDVRRGTYESLNQVDRFVTDPHGIIWATLQEDDNTLPGFYSFDGSKWSNPYFTEIQNPKPIGFAQNGDFWVWGQRGAVGPENMGIGRIRQGTLTWMSRSEIGLDSVEGAFGLAEVPNGDLWMYQDSGSPWSGVIRLSGTKWTLYKPADLPSSFAGDTYGIGIDSQGHVWLPMRPPVYFDGTKWNKAEESVQQPFRLISVLHTDSQGRMWASGTLSTGGQGLGYLKNSVWSISESPRYCYEMTESQDGEPYCFTGENAEGRDLFVYRNDAWQLIPGVTGLSMSIQQVGLVDISGNIWSGYITGLGVGRSFLGDDYLADIGQWASATQWRADFAITAEMLPGTYSVGSRGGTGLDGLPALHAYTTTFDVAYAGGVTTQPPASPKIRSAYADTLNSVVASWSPSGSGSVSYRYAIGTSPGVRDVAGWSYVTGTNVNRTGISLTNGATYYLVVQSRNASGIWSVSAISAPFFAGGSRTLLPNIQR